MGRWQPFPRERKRFSVTLKSSHPVGAWVGVRLCEVHPRSLRPDLPPGRVRLVDAEKDTQELRTRSVLWRLFSSLLRSAAPRSAMRLQDGIMFVSRTGSRLIRHRDVRGLSLRRGLLGRRLVVHTAEAMHILRGLRAGAREGGGAPESGTGLWQVRLSWSAAERSAAASEPDGAQQAQA